MSVLRRAGWLICGFSMICLRIWRSCLGSRLQKCDPADEKVGKTEVGIASSGELADFMKS
jgi:hypothetical protein